LQNQNSFDREVIGQAKRFADKNNISLSRLTKFLYSRMTSGTYKSLEELPISDWVGMMAGGEAEYLINSKSRKSRKEDYLKRWG
jgi:hypothetical protein